MELLDFDGSTDSLELLGDLLGFFLGDAFLDGLGSSFDHVLGFLEAQALHDFADNLDDLDLFRASVLQDDIELGLFFFSSGSAGVQDVYGAVLAGCNNTFFHEQGKLSRAIYMPWKAQEDLLYHTDGAWTTVTIPLSDFVYDWDGNKISSTLLSPADFGAFNIFVVRGDYNGKTALPEGVSCVPVIKIDNIRVVPNK